MIAKRSPRSVSFEFFPPRSMSGERAIMTCAHALRRFDPTFQTVTFGADGGERHATLQWTTTLEAVTGVPTASHLTLCAFDNRDAFEVHLGTLRDHGVTRVVLIRGDVGDDMAGFACVADAVEVVRRDFAMDVSVSAYPETHPKAVSADEDFDALLGKIDAGASRALTQFFFRNEDFLRLRDRLASARRDAVLVPGVMPIQDFDRIAQFAERCGASVPAEWFDLFGSCGDDRAARTEVARDLICTQVAALADEGVRDLHVYTMNRVDLTADAMRAFGANAPSETAVVTRVA